MINISKMSDEFSSVFNETDEMFRNSYNQGIVGNDIVNILTDRSLFEAYKEQLDSLFDANDREAVSTMMDNTRSDILTEASMGTIQPFASLTMPILVKLWARLTLTEAIPTEPVSTPAFTVSWIKPFILGHDGNKYVRLVA